MKKYLIIMLALLLTLLPYTSAEPQQVDVGLYILNLGKFDVGTGAFTADFYLSMKCEEECSPDKFEFMNGRAASIDKAIDKPNEKFYRIQANLNSPVDLKKFPFDSQKMQIIIEDKEQTTEDLIYNPDMEESGIDPAVTFPGWNLDGWTAEASEHDYPVYGEKYSQYVFSIDISRIKLNSFIKTFLPIIFIILVALCSFLLDPDKVSTRMGMVGSALAASVMFHVSISNQIPPVGYLTFADKFMGLTYFILLLSFTLNVVMMELQARKKDHLVNKMHAMTEYSIFVVVPLLYLLLFIFGI
ncbi:hypothetical protein FJZ53_03680 [Candidatus Woesearchaeota archaeon]|nr:hypothetical protein [Candidatus Woesearchaeota archaeon]